MISIFRKEVNSFLNSMIAYIVIIAFLATMGLFMWVFPSYKVFTYGSATLETLFVMAPFFFMLLIPVITMRMFAEEKKSGTMELLLTRPVSDIQLILGKYFAAILLVVFTIIPTLVYYVTVYILGNPMGNVDTPGVIGSYIGLIFLGSVFSAFGLFASSVTENQITAAILAIFISFLFYFGFQSLAALKIWGNYSLVVEQLGVAYHYDAISKGVIDSRDILYFLSLIFFALFATKVSLSSRKW